MILRACDRYDELCIQKLLDHLIIRAGIIDIHANSVVQNGSISNSVNPRVT